MVMLVLTQLSVGALWSGCCCDCVLEARQAAGLRPLLAANALGFGLLALSASVFHLGRPLYAFRAVLGLRHSWLSREIVAFGVFAGLATAYALATFVLSSGDLASENPHAIGNSMSFWVRWLGWSVAASGIVAMFCSVMIYVFTSRECWSFTRVACKFGLTAALLGVAAVWLTILLLTLVHPSSEMTVLVHQYGPRLCMLMMTLAVAKFVWQTLQSCVICSFDE